jgi:hypothetical protein
MDIGRDAELEDFLQLAANEADVSVTDLLRRVLHVNLLAEDPRFRQLFGTADSKTRALLMNLDRRLRVLNPGLHYVYRSTYLGYRREGGITKSAASERSQIFLSLVPRIQRLQVMLPIDPAPYVNVSGCRVVTGHGHHGVGELQVDLPNEDALNRFFHTFHGWLLAPASRASAK